MARCASGCYLLRVEARRHAAFVAVAVVKSVSAFVTPYQHVASAAAILIEETHIYVGQMKRLMCPAIEPANTTIEAGHGGVRKWEPACVPLVQQYGSVAACGRTRRCVDHLVRVAQSGCTAAQHAHDQVLARTLLLIPLRQVKYPNPVSTRMFGFGYQTVDSKINCFLSEVP
jgi:hypothetical protein